MLQKPRPPTTDSGQEKPPFNRKNLEHERMEGPWMKEEVKEEKDRKRK